MTKRYRGKLETVIEDLDLPNPVIRSYCRDGSLKQYVRDHLTLRTEATSNNVRDFGVAKSIEQLPQCGIVVGTAMLVGIYVLANIGYFSALGVDGVAASNRVASDAATVVLGPSAGKAMAAVKSISAGTHREKRHRAPEEVSRRRLRLGDHAGRPSPSC